MSTEKLAMNKQIIDEAALWFVELNEDEPDLRTRQRFDAWLCQSPEHVRAYLKILPIWEAGADLETVAAGDPEALIAWARATNSIVPFDAERCAPGPEPGFNARATQTPVANAQSRDHRLGRRHRPGLAIAASVAFLCVAFATGWLAWEGRSSHATAVGEQRVIALADGSTIKLNSRSKIKIRFAQNERAIELMEGQALFQVAKDKARPFVVRSGDVTVRAVGTQFDVYRKAVGTVVTVVEGRVAVTSGRVDSTEQRSAVADARNVAPASIPLAAGEQLVLSQASASTPHQTDVDRATAWTQQLLVFSSTPLAEVAKEFNRYNERQLVIEPGALTDFNVTGTFSSTNPLGLTRFLQAQPGVQVIETKDRILVSSR